MTALDGAEQSLEEEAMIDLTHDAIQVLLDHPKGEGMIVSCYADTSVTEGFVSLWSQHLKNEASAIERALREGFMTPPGAIADGSRRVPKCS